jgi:hypothetical protein
VESHSVVRRRNSHIFYIIVPEGLTAGLGIMGKRKIPYPYWESNLGSRFVQPIA